MGATYDHKHYAICKDHEKYLEFESVEDAVNWVDDHNRDYHNAEWVQDKLEEQSHFAWEAGFSAACREWQLQNADPSHPITRENPYARKNA